MRLRSVIVIKAQTSSSTKEDSNKDRKWEHPGGEGGSWLISGREGGAESAAKLFDTKCQDLPQARLRLDGSLAFNVGVVIL